MDKKKSKRYPEGDTKGFEEFIEGQHHEASFMNRSSAINKEVSFEHFTFLKNDSERLMRIRNLLHDKIPFAQKYGQGDALLKEQLEEIRLLREKIFEICDRKDSPYRKSLSEIFDAFFEPPRS
jgi:hypothetical protein